MDTLRRDKRETKLRQNVEVAVERELRQAEQAQQRERLPGEKERLKEKWIESARRIDRSGMLPRIWKNERSNPVDAGQILGYFGGVNFDKNGKIIR